MCNKQTHAEINCSIINICCLSLSRLVYGVALYLIEGAAVTSRFPAGNAKLGHLHTYYCWVWMGWVYVANWMATARACFFHSFIHQVYLQFLLLFYSRFHWNPLWMHAVSQANATAAAADIRRNYGDYNRPRLGPVHVVSLTCISPNLAFEL